MSVPSQRTVPVTFRITREQAALLDKYYKGTSAELVRRLLDEHFKFTNILINHTLEKSENENAA
jgi:hypothetical protein